MHLHFLCMFQLTLSLLFKVCYELHSAKGNLVTAAIMINIFLEPIFSFRKLENKDLLFSIFFSKTLTIISHLIQSVMSGALQPFL